MYKRQDLGILLFQFFFRFFVFQRFGGRLLPLLFRKVLKLSLIHIWNLRCRDLACSDDLSGCGHDLAGNAGSGVLRKTGIYHRVRDGVAELVGMSLGD